MNDPQKNKRLPKLRNLLERVAALLAREPQNRNQVMAMLRDAEGRHVLSPETLGMIERIFHVSEMQVREIMIPKAQMIIIPQNSQLEEILPVVISSGHSRFPVVDKRGKEIIGILLAKDLIKFCVKAETVSFVLDNVLRPVVYTSQSKRLDILLREFRTNRNHLAIVLDEYGHVAGLITIEDVLEQIVGEIEDEYDIEEEGSNIKKISEDVFIVKAATLIDEFNTYFSTLFTNEEFDTIGGIVLKAFSHLPKRGESVKLENLRFKILHSDNRRIYLIEVKAIKSKKS